MKKLALIVLVALIPSMSRAQQPSKSEKPPTAPPTTAKTSSQEPTPPEEGQIDTLPDQNIDPPETVAPSPSDVSQQQKAVASLRTAIPAGALSLAASLGKNILVVRVNGRDVRTFPVSVGLKGHPTPQGHFGIRHIVWNPSWHPPKAAWAKNKKAAGPGSSANPMKVVKIFFQEPDYYIHGTDHESKLGAAASHGCIRMSQDSVYELGRLLQERAGAERQAAWYARVINAGQTASVMLPKAVPIVIGY
ncbi:MAG: L,D-transpeptidase [Acidobacteriota bacterium]|nr:L,D-transpeptidase [Acidobacteriota bacterium]